jgi:hypothetical protein
MAAKRRPPPAQQQMFGMLVGYWVSQLLFVAADLGIADVLAKGPLAPRDIAQRVGAHAPTLRRVLRALANIGVFAEGAGGRYRLTPLAQTLRSGRPGSLRDFARMVIDDHHWLAWGGLLQGVRSGLTPFDQVHGLPAFEFLRKHPEKDRIFSASMASISVTQNGAIANAYPFGDLKRLIDVGGAHGHLIATILGKFRRLHGVLYDQPAVVASAAASGFITNPKVRERCEVIGGDFFVSVPAGADAYIMKYIIHDWDDERCLRILGNCRDAMTADGRILVVDHVLPAGNAPSAAKLIDINMFVVPGGQERTREEFVNLFARAGLRLKRVLKTASPISILEAVRR